MALSCLQNQSICLVRGQALEINIPVKNADGSDADLTGATITMGIATSELKDYQVSISTTVSGNVITGKITSAQSELLTNAKYYFSAWIEIMSDYTPVAKGYLTIVNDSRTA